MCSIDIFSAVVLLVGASNSTESRFLSSSRESVEQRFHLCQALPHPHTEKSSSSSERGQQHIYLSGVPNRKSLSSLPGLARVLCANRVFHSPKP